MRFSPIASSTLVAAALTLAGCADQNPNAPRARVHDPSFELLAAEGPDSTETVVSYAYEPETNGQPAAHAGLMALVAAPAQPTIRIGVVQSASSVTLGSTGDYEIKEMTTGVTYFTGTAGGATVTLAEKPADSFYRLQVVCGSAPAVAARVTAAQAAGYVTFTEFVPSANCTRLYLGKFAPPPANTFVARTAFKNTAVAGGFAAADAFWRVVTNGTPVYRVTHGTASRETIYPLVMTSSTGFVTINGARYRGDGAAVFNGTDALAGVNVLPVEQYLYGVVPRELGPTLYPEVEAQKAQAVAARTYSLANIGRRASAGYDLRATTDDQVYGGYAAEHPVSNAAVDATAGVVATYGGSLINALYSSTSGGHTADNEEAFNGAVVPYLRGVPDAERGEALEHVPSLDVFMAHANPQSLRAAKEGDFESDWSNYHRWTFEWTNAEITDVLSSTLGVPVGNVSSIEVTQRGPSGRALQIVYTTDAGTFTATRDAIRASLRYINASGAKANLPSTLFFIEPVVERGNGGKSGGAITGWRVYGGGFGHGVGLSQTGAVGMAQKNHSYDEILAHYYQGVSLDHRY